MCFRSAADVDGLTCSSDSPDGLPELCLPTCRLPCCTRCWLPPSTWSIWLQHVKARQCLCYPFQLFLLYTHTFTHSNPHWTVAALGLNWPRDCTWNTPGPFIPGQTTPTAETAIETPHLYFLQSCTQDGIEAGGRPCTLFHFSSLIVTAWSQSLENNLATRNHCAVQRRLE